MKTFVVILLTASCFSVAYGSEKQFFIGLGQKPVCVNNNDYCKDNTDCCSRNCTSNRCTGSIALPVTQVFFATTTQQSVVALADRFSQDEERNCQRKGAKCTASLNCCKFLTCEKNFCRDKSVFVNGTETLGQVEIEGLANRFSDNEDSSVKPTITAGCGNIGDKCFTPSDCCTPLKCHSFLHQCVT